MGASKSTWQVRDLKRLLKPASRMARITASSSDTDSDDSNSDEYYIILLERPSLEEDMMQ
jgi:hypothetical protein